MEFNDYSIENKNGREKLKNSKHGIRKEQIDKKYHNLFNAYDTNNNGTLETTELERLKNNISTFAGSDKILNTVEANAVNSVFKSESGLNDTDFMGFVKSVSDAGQDILKSTESFDDDGGKIISTKYKNGLTETLYFYPDGEFKLKTQFQDTHDKSIWYEFNGKRYTEQQRKDLLDNEYNKYKNNNSASGNKEIKGIGGLLMSKDLFIENFLKTHPQLATPHSMDNHILIDNTELSERAKKDVEVRDFVLRHYIETHTECKAMLDELGIFGKAGAALSAGTGEAWNWIKNKWNGTEEEYKNFYELAAQFEDNYDRALVADGRLKDLEIHQAGYFDGYNNTLGQPYKDEKGEAFLESTQRFFSAKGLNDKIELLKNTIKDLSNYRYMTGNGASAVSSLDALSMDGGISPMKKIEEARQKLIAYFDNDEDMANAFINDLEISKNGVIIPDKLIDTLKGLQASAEDNLKSILGTSSIDDAKADYIQQYKNMYGTDFVPEELSEKAGTALEVGGMVKLGALTAISYLLTRSPLMANAAEALGGSALARVLVSKVGQQAANRIIQEGIRFAGMTTTIGLDAGLTAVDQLTSEAGLSGDKMLASTAGAAKFIGFSTYIGGPLSQAVAKMLGKYGATARIFTGGEKVLENGVQKTTVNGAKFLQNLDKCSKSLLAKAGAFATDAGAFTMLEVATEGTDVLDEAKNQGEFLGKLKIMNHAIEYMLGKMVHGSSAKLKMNAAIERSGVKDWKISELKSKSGTEYIVETKDGIPVGNFKDVNILATAMLERVSKAIEGMENTPLQTHNEQIQKKPTSVTEENKTSNNEEVAPFAQRLTRTPNNEELTAPERREITLENGEFNEQGEFVSDGTRTITESGNPLAKSTTYRVYPDGKRKIAQNFNDFIDQMCELSGTDKKQFNKYYIDNFKRYFKEHPDVSVADFSEAINDLMHATGKNNISKDYDLYNFSFGNITEIKDFKTFKANIKEFDNLITELKSKSSSKNDNIIKCLQNVKPEYLCENMVEVKPEEFKKNLEFFSELELDTQIALTEYTRTIKNLFTAKDDKYYENIRIADEYNKWAVEFNKKHSTNIPKYKANVRYFGNYNEQEIAQVKKNIELAKEIITNGINNERLLSDILYESENTSSYTDLAAMLKAELGDKFDYKYFEKIPDKRYFSDKAQFDLPIELIKMFPEGMDKLGYNDLSRLTNQYLKLDDTGKQNMKAKIAIVQKMPQLVSHNNKVLSEYLYKFLSEKQIPQAEKISEFIELADPEFISKIGIEDKYRRAIIKFDELFTPETIDNMIECAKLHRELPKKLADHLKSENSIIKKNPYSSANELNYQYNIPASELRECIDLLNKYSDSLSPKMMEMIYLRRFNANEQTVQVLTKINPLLANEMCSYSKNIMEIVNNLDPETVNKFLNVASRENITQRNVENFLRNYGYNKEMFDIFQKFTTEELDAISFETISQLNTPIYEKTIADIKKAIAATPKRIREVIKEEVGFSYYDDYKKINDGYNYTQIIAELEKLSDIDLKSIGSKTIISFIEENLYSWKSHLNNENVKIWRSVPQEVKDKLGEYSKYLLTSDNIIDVNIINEKFNKLTQQEAFESINGREFIELILNSSKEIEERMDKILKDSEYDRNNINNLLYNMRHKPDDLNFMDELINNSKLENNEISSIYQQLSKNTELKEKQKEFVRYLVERDDVDNSLIKDLLGTISKYTYNFNSSRKFDKNQVSPITNKKIEFVKELLDNPNIKNQDISNIIQNIQSEEFFESYKQLATDMINLKTINPYFINEIIRTLKSGWNKTTDTESANGFEIANRLLNETYFDVGTINKLLKIIKAKPEESHSLVMDFIMKYKDNENIPMEQIIINCGNNANLVKMRLEFAEELVAKLKPELIGDIIRQINTPEQKTVVQSLFNDNTIPNENIHFILAECNNNAQHKILIENLYNNKDFPNKFLSDIVKYLYKDKNHFDNLNKMLNNPEMEKWFVKNLENGLSIDIIFRLSRTQKQLFNEARNTQTLKSKQVETKADLNTPVIQEAKPEEIVKAEEALVSVGVHPKMAPNYVKMCQENGIVDKVKLDAVCALAQVGVPVKEIKNIFNLAVGNSLSNADGVFRPDIIKDIVILKQNGIEDIKLAANIAAVKNMTPLELKGRINTKIRQDLINRINDLDSQTKGQLKTIGIDADMIIEKANAEPKGGKVKQAEVPKIKLRSLDSIVGVEKIILNKYKNEIDQNIWGDPARFKAWAEERLKKVLDFEQNPDYIATGQFQHFNNARKQGVENWYKFLKEESNYKDDVFVHLLVMEGITGEMKPNNAFTPPAVSHESFEATYNALLQNNTKVSFNDIYAKLTKLKAIQQFSKGTRTVDGIEGQWVTIPRSQRGEPDYDEHIAMVQALAEGSSWCLRFENAHTYLQNGNLHFFVDKNGNSQVAINETDGEITQIQKRYKQDSSVPVAYANVIETWAKENNYIGLENSRQTAVATKPQFDQHRAIFTKLQEEGRYLEIFKELGIKVTTAQDGTYILSGYNPMHFNKYTLFDLGINENKLLENVSEIHSNLDLDGSSVNALPKLRVIKGTLTFGDNKVSDLRSLENLQGKKIFWDK